MKPYVCFHCGDELDEGYVHLCRLDALDGGTSMDIETAGLLGIGCPSTPTMTSVPFTVSLLAVDP